MTSNEVCHWTAIVTTICMDPNMFSTIMTQRLRYRKVKFATISMESDILSTIVYIG